MSDGKSILLEGDNVFTRDDLQWNDSITVQVLPNEGYKFVGWEGGEPRQLSSQGNYTINVRKDTYVKAIFAQAKYDLSVKANDGGQVKVTIGDNQQSFIVDKDNSLDLKELVHGTKILIEAIPDVKRNYKLNNWNDDKTDNSLTKEFELTKDTSLVANFDEISKQTHSFVASVSDGGEIRINNLGKKYTRYTTTIEEGNEVQIEAIAKDGYVFDRWSDDATIKDLSRTITVKNDMQISAYFTKKVYKIYLYTVGNGQIKLLENTLKAIEQVKEPFKIHVFSAHYNDVITIEALPDVAYFYFKGWSDCEGADSVRRTITVTDDLWLGAQFGYTDKNVLTIPETKNVTYKVDGVEINTPYYKQLNDGEKVKIEAIVEDNYKIKCWSDNAITSSERDIAFYKDLTIFPILEEKEKKYEHIDWWKNTTPINSKFFTTVCDRVDPNSKFVTDDNDFYCNFGKGKYTDPLSGSQYDVMRIEGCGKYTDIGSTEQNPDTAALNFTT
ncbi:MAG: InlB B-repeat-containing protein, partial [Malacoplasma sp.]|nr:InlB B-repeat-containing protein [Malacoplasma sp.]